MKSPKRTRPIGITLGDPSGIGPEVVARALTKPSIRRLGPFVLIGELAIYRKYAPSLRKDCAFFDLKSMPLSGWKPGKISRASGRSALNALNKSVELLKRKQIAALVTAPVSKEAIGMTRPSFHGHTEFLADAFGAKIVGMMFVADRLRTIIVTRHLPISQVPRAINSKNILQTIELTDQALRKMFKLKNPTIGVCGLNPHAGEGGTIGREEIVKVIPAIRKARRHRINVLGPFAADTLFAPVTTRGFDAIVAMYHDQGLIPVKTLCLHHLVNLTIGLPFIRTSPAHGTAFDIAGKNKADPSSMCAAIKLAAELAP